MVKVSEKGKIFDIVLDRPSVLNALDQKMISKISDTFLELNASKNVNGIIISGNGKSFCAGADLNYMKSFASLSREENLKDAKDLSYMFEQIYNCPHPVVVRAQGHIAGGGIGLVSLGDIVACEENAKFSFGEVKLGMVPSVISQYIVNKIGYSSALELMLTGETFDAEKALQKNLVHFVGSSGKVDEFISEKINTINSVGYNALRHTKKLIKKFSETTDLKRYCIELIADVRTSKEAQERIEKFFKTKKG